MRCFRGFFHFLFVVLAGLLIRCFGPSLIQRIFGRSDDPDLSELYDPGGEADDSDTELDAISRQEANRRRKERHFRRSHYRDNDRNVRRRRREKPNPNLRRRRSNRRRTRVSSAEDAFLAAPIDPKHAHTEALFERLVWRVEDQMAMRRQQQQQQHVLSTDLPPSSSSSHQRSASSTHPLRQRTNRRRQRQAGGRLKPSVSAELDKLIQIHTRVEVEESRPVANHSRVPQRFRGEEEEDHGELIPFDLVRSRNRQRRRRNKVFKTAEASSRWNGEEFSEEEDDDLIVDIDSFHDFRTSYEEEEEEKKCDDDTIIHQQNSFSSLSDHDNDNDHDDSYSYLSLLFLTSNCVRKVFINSPPSLSSSSSSSSSTLPPHMLSSFSLSPPCHLFVSTTFRAFQDRHFARRWPALSRLSKVVCFYAESCVGFPGKERLRLEQRKTCEGNGASYHSGVFSLKRMNDDGNDDGGNDDEYSSSTTPSSSPLIKTANDDELSFLIQAEQLRDIIEKMIPVLEIHQNQNQDLDQEEEEGERERERKTKRKPVVLVCCNLDDPSSPTVSPQHFRRGTSPLTPKSVSQVFSRDDGPRVACVALALAFCMRQENISFKEALQRQRDGLKVLRREVISLGGEMEEEDVVMDVDLMWEDEYIPQFVVSVLRDYESQGWSFAAKRMKRERDFREAAEWGRRENRDRDSGEDDW